MIQQTVHRLTSLVPHEKIFVVATEALITKIKEQLPELPDRNFIVEPTGKNTAPCIGLGCIYLRRRYPDEVMAVLPADHLVRDPERFQQQLSAGEELALETDALVTLGITPTYPATGYGYIQHTNERFEKGRGVAYRVKTFAEKPNIETARRFLASGDFLWNSGIFLWKMPTILREIEAYLPDVAEGLARIDKAIGTDRENAIVDNVYRQIKSVSIDYGIMEHAKNVAVLPCKFGWNDLGSWEEVYNVQDKDANGNVTDARHILIDSKGCLIDSQKRVVGAIGLEDMIVVDTEDALLICPRSRAQDVREIIDALKRKKADYLL